MRNVLNKNQRYTLLQLSDSFSSLTEIMESVVNYENDYLEPLTAVTAVKNIPDNLSSIEKNYTYKWDNISGIDKIIINDQEEIPFFVAIASIESATRLLKNKITGELLPKDERLNVTKIETIFIVFNNKIYCIVATINFYELDRVKKLIGTDNVTSVPSPVDSDLFQWLFYKYINNQRELSDEIVLDNIKGFTGTVVSDDNRFEGQSDQIAELIIAKAFLTNGYPLTSVRLVLNTNEGTINFYLGKVIEDQEYQIKVERLSYIDPLLVSAELEVSIPIYIYFYLIPKLVEIYGVIKENYISTDKNDFLSEIGIEVIKTIMERNDISFDDISDS